MFVSSFADDSEFALATVTGRVPILQTDNERFIVALVRFCYVAPIKVNITA